MLRLGIDIGSDDHVMPENSIGRYHEVLLDCFVMTQLQNLKLAAPKLTGDAATTGVRAGDQAATRAPGLGPGRDRPRSCAVAL